MANIAATHVTKLFLESWIIPYSMPPHDPPGDGGQFTRKLFATLCSMLGFKHMTATAYHPQNSGQVERHILMIVIRLRNYDAENHRD